LDAPALPRFGRRAHAVVALLLGVAAASAAAATWTSHHSSKWPFKLDNHDETVLAASRIAAASAAAATWTSHHSSKYPFKLDDDDETVLAASRTHLEELSAGERRKVEGKALAPVEGLSFCEATAQNKLDVMMYLIDHRADVNAKDETRNPTVEYPIMNCRRSGDHPYAARLLLAAKADPNVKNGFGWTALMMTSFENPGIEALKVMLAHGADVNLKTRDTALNDACWNCVPAIVKILLEAKADIELTGDSDWTPLQAAVATPNCYRNKDHTDIVKMLLDAGAKLDVISQEDFDRIMAEREEVQKLLLDAGWKPPY